jgi:hypothetical protein
MRAGRSSSTHFAMPAQSRSNWTQEPKTHKEEREGKPGRDKSAGKVQNFAG